MLKQERAAFISKRLNEIYPETPVPLKHRDAYQLLVAVLLSAQCTDARVNIVTPGLFAKASTAQDMAVLEDCLLYTSPSPRDATLSRMPSSA